MTRHLSLLFIIVSSVMSQDLKLLSGQLDLDFRIAGYQLYIQNESNYNNEISPLKVGLMSAIIPGSGEFYMKDYLKSALFLTLEVVSWYFYFSYTKRGDEQTRKFKQYADENWSVVDYAVWMNEWMRRYGDDDAPFIRISPNETLKPWQRVDWSELNKAEDYISRKTRGFSHRLPFYGEQQYYELIGKYHQYAPGWNDFDRNFIPESVDLLSPTSKFKFYSLERGKANDFYSVATTSALIIVTNHILSAVDATVSAILHNKKVRSETSLSYDSNFGLMAKLKIRFDF